MSSGNTCTSTASWLPSGPGTVVVPMKEPTLMSDSDILVIPTTRMSPVMRSLTSSPLRDLTDSTSPSMASMVPRTRDGDGGCWAIAYKADATTMATATSGRMRVERRTGMSWSPVAPPNMGHRRLSDIPGSNLCEIGLNQRAKLGRHLGALAEPEFEPAHRLVRQHAGVELQRGLAVHAKRRRVDQDARARQQAADGIPCDGVNTGAELMRQRMRAFDGAVRQMHA